MRNNVSIAIVLLLLAVALIVQSAKVTKNPLNIDNLPHRSVLYKDVVKDTTLHDDTTSIKKGESRIVGGNEVTPNSLPHQAALTIDGQYFCGGSLISDTWVLTSALCLYGAWSVVVTLGAHNLNQAEPTQQKITSNIFRIHPDYNPTTLRNDVALVKLPYAAKLNEYVSPVCLVASNVTIKDGTNVIASGWGKTSQSDPTYNTPILRSVSNPTISNKECGMSFIDSNFIGNGMMCTDTAGGKGICPGDNGGPLTISGRSVIGFPNKRQCQVGISSFVIDTCQAGYPAGFSRISYYIDDFITKETGIQPCKECSGAMILPSILASIVILLGSLIFSRFIQLV